MIVFELNGKWFTVPFEIYLELQKVKAELKELKDI
jgi:hypothetical protein